MTEFGEININNSRFYSFGRLRVQNENVHNIKSICMLAAQ